jgi:hypothetical protein
VKSDRTLKRWYNFINRKFFLDELPSNVCVRWSNDEDDEDGFEEKYFGLAQLAEDGRHKYEIVMSRKMNIPAATRLTSLAHEMCHVATELRDDHGPVFSAWHMRLTARGFFEKGACRKGLTVF